MGLIPIESAINPAADTDAMMGAVLGIIGLCFELAAYGEAMQRTARWLRRRTSGRLGNYSDPPTLDMGLVGIFWGVVFLIPGLLAFVWVSPVFGGLWSLGAGFFLAMHVYQTFLKRYGNGKRGWRASRPVPDPAVRRRLEQLKGQRDAGLITEEEYRARRREESGENPQMEEGRTSDSDKE